MSWQIVSKPEDDFQIIESDTHIYLTEKDVTEEQIKTGEVQPYLTAKIDTHDSRITTVVNQRCLPAEKAKQKKAAVQFTTYLDTFKGKSFILCDAEQTDIFLDDKTTTIDPCKRTVETTPMGLRGGAEAKESTLPRGCFLQHITDPAKYFDRILYLMERSDFLLSKIEEYKAKGVEGIRVMFENSRVQCLFSPTGKLIGLCRDTNIGVNDSGKKLGYLGDTLIDPDFFMTAKEKLTATSDESIAAARERGTKHLYRESSEAMDYDKILLIAPPKREKEFSDNFGFNKPESTATDHMVTLYRFDKATPKYQIKMMAHAETINARLKVLRQNQKMLLGGVLALGSVVALGVFSRFRSTAITTPLLVPSSNKLR